MKGYTITINKKNINIGVQNGLVLLIYDTESKDKSNSIQVSGIDNGIGQHLKWENISIQKGDKIRITACDLEDSIPPVSREIIDPQEILKEYNDLKKILTEEGIIK
ncbi:Uncharacterised protein [Sphingobacterium spiritivorum]|uniref:Uncharacterized protein n=1 Tax=Sphingobacterium spiritivorum TaxID=258 RepID=A0A380CV69_SPHSI|nr:hypothetical protein [Sphingobacterium spiritivorum]SUJ28272.1 Uncharacterised protein [Sphingobacterium spiritivorum]